MTEKRFTVGYFEDPNPVDSYVECDGEYLNVSDTVKLLNQFQKENEQLTPFLNIARDYNLTLDQLYGVLEETLEEK